MSNNNLSIKLDRINSATDRIRTKLDMKGAVIEDVATRVEQLYLKEYKLGTKNITANGTFSATADNLDGFSSVVVNVPSGGTPVKSNIYRVPIISAMNNITDMVEGDMCIVHRPNTENATVDTTFQTAIFPDTVVIGTAVTDYINIMYRPIDTSSGIDCMGMLNSSSFRMDCYSESGSIEIQYTSEDGITYTRTDNTGNPVDFGTELYCPYAEEWNEAIGYFIQISSIDFEGIFEYKNGIWKYAKIGMDTTSDYIYKDKKAYTDNGVLEGNLGGIPSILFDDMNAELYGSVKAAYSNLSPIKPTVEELSLIKCCPVNNEGEPLVDLTDVLSGVQYFNFSEYGGLTNLTAIEDIKLPSSVISINMTDSKLKYFNLSPKSGFRAANFMNCKELEYIGDISFMSYANYCYVFYGTEKLKHLPKFTPSGECKSMASFSGIIEINDLDFSNVTDAEDMFNDCKNLEEIGNLNLGKATNIVSMFHGCEKLHTVGNITLPSQLYYGNGMFSNCPNLSNDSLNNILAGFRGFKTAHINPDGSASYVYITLKEIGLDDEQIEKCHNLSNYSAFISAGNADR